MPASPPYPIKAAFIIARYPPLSGGAEAQAKSLAQALAARGVEVTVLTRAYPGLPASETVNGVTVSRLRAPGSGLLASVAFSFSLLFTLLRNREVYDIYHIHLASSHAIPAGFLGPILGIPTTLKFGATREFGDIGTSRNKFGGRWKLDFLKRRINAFVCTSREMVAELTAEGFDASLTHLIPNGVDTATWSPVSPSERAVLRAKLGLNDRPVALFSGRLEPQKGLEALLESWKLIVANHPDAALILAGRGSQEVLLREKADRSGISSSVRFLGQLKPDDLRDYYRVADLFVLPSLAEGLSNALLEAMSCGLPVVASRVGGTEDLVSDGVNGLLMEPGSIQPLADAILRLLEDHPAALQKGMRARETVESGYSLERVAERYLELYRSLHASRVGQEPPGI